MKKICIIIILCFFIACNKFNNKIEQHVGYVVGYDFCSVSINENGFGSAAGYIITSQDLKETFITYNFPDDIFDFPKECFQYTLGDQCAFPDKFRYEFKVQYTYTIATKEEIDNFPIVEPCIFFGHTYLCDNAVPIILKSISKFK